MKKTLLMAALLAAPLAACDGGKTDDSGGSTDGTDGTEPSLYEQLGGEAGVYTVLDAFLGNVLADTRINWMFATADAANLRLQLHDQICAATGGGCTYTGADMVTAHAGMAITDAQFNALVEDLLMALDTLGIPYALDGSQTIDPLLLALVGMQGDIVTDADGTGVYFNQLGGYAAIGAVTDAFLARVAADSRINARFATTDLARLRQLLVEQVCEATGGYCVYTGQNMLDAHAGMCITAGEFTALAEDFVGAYDDVGVPYSVFFDGSQLGDGLVQALLGMQGDIVEECP